MAMFEQTLDGVTVYSSRPLSQEELRAEVDYLNAEQARMDAARPGNPADEAIARMLIEKWDA